MFLNFIGYCFVGCNLSFSIVNSFFSVFVFILLKNLNAADPFHIVLNFLLVLKNICIKGSPSNQSKRNVYMCFFFRVVFYVKQIRVKLIKQLQKKHCHNKFFPTKLKKKKKKGKIKDGIWWEQALFFTIFSMIKTNLFSRYLHQ